MKTNPRSCLALEIVELKKGFPRLDQQQERCYFFHQSLPHSPVPSCSHCLNSDSRVSIQRKLSSSPPAFCVRLMKNSTHCSPVRSALSSLQRNWQSFKSPAPNMDTSPALSIFNHHSENRPMERSTHYPPKPSEFTLVA